MTILDALVGLGVFACALAYDLAFAAYVRAAAIGKAAKAACWSVATYAVGAVGILALVDMSVWYALPEGLGLWCGTFIGVMAGADND